jgi:predicted CXXCH cytochrome family protein
MGMVVVQGKRQMHGLRGEVVAMVDMERARILFNCLIAVVVLLLLWATAMGIIQTGTRSAEAAGIADTYHNLTASGPGTIKGTGISEICVFCHTPHFGATSTEDSGPLWNRTLSTATYTLYSSPTLDAAPTQPTSVSKACLSCHDGTVGMNQLRNRPGTGLQTSSNPSNATDTKIGGATPAQSNDASLIGTDLSNDHPVSMVYANAKSPGLGTATLGDDTNTSGFRPTITSGTRTLVNGTVVAGTAPATGIQLPLYSGGKVECASCHDPHEARTKSATQVWFLRASNDGSAVCRTCHLK